MKSSREEKNSLSSFFLFLSSSSKQSSIAELHARAKGLETNASTQEEASAVSLPQRADALLPWNGRIDDGKSESWSGVAVVFIAVVFVVAVAIVSTPTFSPSFSPHLLPPAESCRRRRFRRFFFFSFPSFYCSRTGRPRGLLPLPGRPRARRRRRRSPVIKRPGARLAPALALHGRGLRREGPRAPRGPAEEGGPARGPPGRL